MKFKMLIIVGTLFTTLISGNSLNVNAAHNTSVQNKMVQSAKELSKTKLIGNWYRMDSKKAGMLYSIDKDGGVNWLPIGGTGNNTTVTSVKKIHGLIRLKLTYVTGGSKYGFFKVTSMKIAHKSLKVLQLHIGNSKTLNSNTKFIIATKNKIVLPLNKKIIKI